MTRGPTSGAYRGTGEIGEFIVDVRLDDNSPPLRATFQAQWYAADGDVVRSRFEPRTSAKLDERAEWRKLQAAAKADQASEDPRFDDSARQTPGTRTDDSGSE